MTKETKPTDGIENITQYRTSDGKVFNDLDEANKHQEKLNNFDYKKGYYELLQKVKMLETQLEFQKKFNSFQPLFDKFVSKDDNQKSIIIKYEGQNPNFPYNL